MTDTQMMERLASWCDQMRLAIETYTEEQSESLKKLKLVASSFQNPSIEMVKKETH